MVIGPKEDWKIRMIQQFEGQARVNLSNEVWSRIFETPGLISNGVINQHVAIVAFVAAVRDSRAASD